ncbi:snoaL-like domain protein [mine drainage metagenome]|uniref:SnoaL-like domain protein n=1 Tax=mine drainage metagenome TaxID=410659 RepID=A0A1J5SL43_9ZZZZ
MTYQDDLAHFIHLFETLSQENVGALTELYTADAFFKDPFNEVHGQTAIIKILEHMFTQVDEPRFVVTRSILQGEDAFIVWDFLFRLKDRGLAGQRIHGTSHVRFGPDHKVNYHRDYWDTAEELYEKIPLLGSLMRFLKRKVQAS